LMLLAIPFDSLPMLVENLQDMEWVPPLHRLSEEEKLEQFQKTVNELEQEYKNG
jgi:hypothetical protein